MRSSAEGDYVEYLTARLGRLHRAAYLLCGDADRADDVVQVTAVALYKHWEAARKAVNIDAFVHRILVRSHLHERRLRWSRVPLAATVPDRIAAADHDIAEGAELRDALAALPAGQRAVLVLRFFCDIWIADTAVALRCFEGTVKSQAALGLPTLRYLLAPAPSIDGEQKLT
jgi:DNA-directed RNA polymerase specialized sigma24 family protein